MNRSRTWMLNGEYRLEPGFASCISDWGRPSLIEGIELLGHELHLFVNSGNNSLVSIVDTRLTPGVGNDVDLVVDVDAMPLFEKDTERAIR